MRNSRSKIYDDIAINAVLSNNNDFKIFQNNQLIDDLGKERIIHENGNNALVKNIFKNKKQINQEDIFVLIYASIEKKILE